MPRWNGGAWFREKPTGQEYSFGYGFGPELRVGLLRHPLHRAYLLLGYLHYGPDAGSGTTQVWTTTSLDRWDIAAGYDFCWRFLIAGLHLGTALTLSQTEQTIYEVSYQVVTTADGSSFLEYTRGEVRDREEAAGLYPGLLVQQDRNLAVPFDPGDRFNDDSFGSIS